MNSKNNKRLMPIGKAAEYLGVSIMTLRRWDVSGKLPAVKLPSGHRYYAKETLERFQEDLFMLGKVWAGSELAPELPKDYYSATQDHFKARLERMAIRINTDKSMSDFAALITAIAGEIGNNSFDHNLGNWPDIPGIYFAYDIDKKIVILADRGIGIRATLSRVLPELRSDKEALRIAITKNISGRAPEQRGNGLKFVRKIALEYPIALSLQSGTAIATIKNTKRPKLNILSADQNVRGVLVKIEY